MDSDAGETAGRLRAELARVHKRIYDHQISKLIGIEADDSALIADVFNDLADILRGCGEADGLSSPQR